MTGCWSRSRPLAAGYLAVLCGLMLLGGCSTRQINAAAYSALQTRGCLQETAMPACAGQQPFDQYRRDRHQVLGQK